MNDPRPGPSSALLRLCLAGLATAPGAALADPIRALEFPREPRCTPIPPSSSLHVGALRFSESLPRPPSAAIMQPDQTIFAVGSGRQIWRRTPETEWASDAEVEAELYGLSASHPQPWAVGASGTVLRRSEPGVWDTLPRPSRQDLTAIDVYTEQLVVVGGGGGGLYLSTDGAASWATLSSGGAAVTSVDMTTDHSIVAGRADGSVVFGAPANDRRSWSATSAQASAAPITAVFAAGGKGALVVDAEGALWSTSDRGESWLHVPAEDDPIRDVVAASVGLVGVHDSGRLSALLLTVGGLQVGSLDRYADEIGVIAPPPEGLSVVSASAAGSALLVVTSDGRVGRQDLQVIITGGHPCGRPLEVEQAAVTAPVQAATGWAAALPPAALPEDSRAALAAAWQADAQAEHASIASFARFSLRLLALGAPAALVRDAQQAMGDEIRHARACFSLASRYAGAPLAPGPLPVHGVMDGGEDLVAVSVEVLREGAVGESIGALLAATMHAQASDPSVRAALGGIAADEARHAQAAWRFLGWAVEQGGAPVREALRAALEDAIAAQAEGPADAPVPAGWEAHGRLRPAAQRRIIRRAIRRVVRPCAAALLDPPLVASSGEAATRSLAARAAPGRG